MDIHGRTIAELSPSAHLSAAPRVGTQSHSVTYPGRPALLKSASVRALSMLSPAEIRELLACEEVISKGWDTFVAVGSALTRIREQRLYRADFDTFEEYCRQRWLYGKAHAYRLIGAAEVIRHLSPIGDIPLPQNEAQVRPLLGLAPDEIQEVWRAVIERAGKNRITARLVERAAAEFRGQRRCGSTPSHRGPAELEQTWSAVREADKLLQRAKRSLRRGQVKTAREFLAELRDALPSPL